MLHGRTIYIEGTGILDDHLSGVGQYILGILRGLDHIVAERSPAPRVKVIIPYDKVEKFRRYGFRHLEPVRLPLPASVMFALLSSGSFPPLDSLLGRGVYIFPRFLAARLRYSPSLTVLYDLSYALYSQYSDDTHASHLLRAVPETLRRSQAVVTISQNARKEIVEYYGLPSERVVVATPAADPEIFYRREPEEISKVRANYGIRGDYILALSNLEPRKNLESLVDAYCELPTALSEQVGLLLVGAMGWKTNDLVQKILQRAEQGYSITRPSSYVLDEHKPAILSGASMLVYPSHYEGFGMPPLEALACGTPVITADNSSLPEVVGNAGHMVSSQNRAQLQSAMLDVLSNLETETLRANTEGPIQARKFCWHKSARTILELAENL